MHRSLVRSRRLAVTAACLLILLAGCKDPPLVPGPEINFVGTWRGQPWQGTASANLASDFLVVHGAAARPEGSSRLYVRAGVRFDGPGTYPLAPGAAEVYTLIGGDVVGEQYVGVAADDAVLIIREHAGGVMSGRLTFTAREANPPAGTQAAEERFDAEFVQAEVRS